MALPDWMEDLLEGEGCSFLSVSEPWRFNRCKVWRGVDQLSPFGNFPDDFYNQPPPPLGDLPDEFYDFRTDIANLCLGPHGVSHAVAGIIDEGSVSQVRHFSPPFAHSVGCMYCNIYSGRRPGSLSNRCPSGFGRGFHERSSAIFLLDSTMDD